MKIENIASYSPTVCRIFKIHHSQRALACFEEYRDMIHFRASRHCGSVASTMDERCIANGNEHLRFYRSTMLCSLSAGGAPTAALVRYCGTAFQESRPISRASRHTRRDGGTFIPARGERESLRSCK